MLSPHNIASRNPLRTLFVTLALIACSTKGHACYTVFNADGAVVLQMAEAPRYADQAVTVPEGGRVSIQSGTCPALGAPPMIGSSAIEDDDHGVVPSRSVPLLTNVDTAAAARVPFERATSTIAVVAPAMAEQVWRQAPLTDLAAPDSALTAHSATGVHATEIVITEWADGRTDVERVPRR